METIGIIGAMKTEVTVLCESLENVTSHQINNLIFYKGKLDGKSVIVVQSGVGKVNAALCAQLLIIKFGVSKIINTGIAGAIGKGLGVFDFVVSSEAVYHDVDASIFGYQKGQIPGLDLIFSADKMLAEKALEVFNESDLSQNHKIMKGRIASGDQFIADKNVKDEIINAFNPMCVEMEGAAIAHACYLNKVPFVIIRCMSDCADDSATNTYEFNEDVCADMCAGFVRNLIMKLPVE